MDGAITPVGTMEVGTMDVAITPVDGAARFGGALSGMPLPGSREIGHHVAPGFARATLCSSLSR